MSGACTLSYTRTATFRSSTTASNPLFSTSHLFNTDGKVKKGLVQGCAGATKGHPGTAIHTGHSRHNPIHNITTLGLGSWVMGTSSVMIIRASMTKRGRSAVGNRSPLAGACQHQLVAHPTTIPPGPPFSRKGGARYDHYHPRLATPIFKPMAKREGSTAGATEAHPMLATTLERATHTRASCCVAPTGPFPQHLSQPPPTRIPTPSSTQWQRGEVCRRGNRSPPRASHHTGACHPPHRQPSRPLLPTAKGEQSAIHVPDSIVKPPTHQKLG
jgi:hypothetical protein